MRLVAFGGGHGLGASLRALRRCQAALDLEITAVVTVGDNGGSSGRLRAQRGALPPGDLRQALAALAATDPHSATTAALFQHRFAHGGPGRAAHAAHAAARAAHAADQVAHAARAAHVADQVAEAADQVAHVADQLGGHAVGNLVLCGLMELLGDPVAALDHAATMVRAGGRVLPMSREPVAIEARVRGADPARPDLVLTVRGQHEVAVSPGRVESVRLDPPKPVACREALTAIGEADWLVFGPGSWYTSVIPHLLVPELAAAIVAGPARRLVILNLTTEPETAGLTLPAHLTALSAYAPGLAADVVLGDPSWVTEPEPVRQAAASLGAELVLAPVAAAGADARHDPAALAEALLPVLAAAR
jgi:uncharacterized cofD-like protein